MQPQAIDMLWITVCAGLVMVMQAGFLCLESGCTRTKNSINVAVKNLADFGLSVLLYWALGFGLMFGASVQGWLGNSLFFPATGADAPWLSTFFLFQAMFCGTAVTIVAGAVAERMSFKGYLLVAAGVSVLIYPLFGHWAWGGVLGGEAGWLAALGFIDFAGSTVVHSVGGWVALAAVMVIGPRLGRFSADNDRRAMPGQSLPMAMLGALILSFGWLGFNGGSTLAWGGDVPAIITNTVLAATSGLISALLLGWQRRGYPDPRSVMNGLLAGLVAITANCHMVAAAEAVIIGAVGAACMLFAEGLLERYRLDDVVGSFPVHTAAGIWGTLAVALFGDPESFAAGMSRLDQLQIQSLGVVACALVSFVPAYVLLRALSHLVPLRVTPEQELMGLNASEHRATTEHLDLLREMELQSRELDLARRVSVEPFTEVGQIAAKYNDVLDALQQTVARTELIIRDTKDGILTCTMDGRILSANPGAEAMFGYRADDLPQKSVWSLVGTDGGASFDSFEAFLEHAGGSGRHVEALRLIGMRQSGERFPLELEATRGVIGGEAVATVRFRDRTMSERYQEQLELAKDEAERARDQLAEKVRQIEVFNNLAVDRESRMMELKQDINRLCLELNREPPFSFSQD